MKVHAVDCYNYEFSELDGDFRLYLPHLDHKLCKMKMFKN